MKLLQVANNNNDIELGNGSGRGRKRRERERGGGGGYRKCSKNCLVGSRNVSWGIFIELYRVKTQTQESLRGGDRQTERGRQTD